MKTLLIALLFFLPILSFADPAFNDYDERVRLEKVIQDAKKYDEEQMEKARKKYDETHLPPSSSSGGGGWATAFVLIIIVVIVLMQS